VIFLCYNREEEHDLAKDISADHHLKGKELKEKCVLALRAA